MVEHNMEIYCSKEELLVVYFEKNDKLTLLFIVGGVKFN